MNNKNVTISKICIWFLLCIVSLSLPGCKRELKPSNSNSSDVSTQTELNETLPDFKIVCLPVGKGDAFILYTKDHTVLIDTGYDTNGKAIGKYLKNTLGIESIDYMIITHYDKDHVGGADKLFDYVHIENAVLNSRVKESTDTTELFNALDRYKVKIIYPGRNDDQSQSINPLCFSIDQAEFLVYPSKQTVYDTDDSNNSSLISTITYGSQHFLFTGDAQKARLTEFIADHGNEHYDLIKMPYHGNYYNEVKKLIENARPQFAVITCSDEEQPSQNTIKVLDDSLVSYYLTSNGTVIFTSNGKSMTAQQ